MEATTPLEGDILANAVKTEPSAEPSAEESEVHKAHADTPEADVKDENTEDGEPPLKKSKVELPVSHAASGSGPKNEPPVHEMVGGSSVRQYLNKHLTAHLLQGLKQISKDKPDDALLALGEFLIQRSKELKGK